MDLSLHSPSNTKLPNSEEARPMWAHAHHVNGLAEVAVDCRAVRRMGWPDAGGAVGAFVVRDTCVQLCPFEAVCDSVWFKG